MAISFPNNPSPNQIWVDPESNITYQFQIDPESPSGQNLGKWTTSIRRNEINLNNTYLRKDASNDPVLSDLDVNGKLKVNANTSSSFTTPPTRGTYGQAQISNGNGTTAWRSMGTNPGPTAPSTPYVGELWLNTTNDTLYTWVDSAWLALFTIA